MNYNLIHYSGTLTGGVTNLSLAGVIGYLTNTANTIVLHTLATTRGPTNIVWVGNPSNENWDTEVSTNWLNPANGLDYFVSGDNPLFSNQGKTNLTVNLADIETPGTVTINTTSNYVFTGNGSIGGIASLVVSNGLLTMLTTNTYIGPTILDGGVLSTPNLGLSGSSSGIGSASSDPANLILNSGTLAYTGASTATDHGITLTNLGGTIDVTNGTTLTWNGALVGSGSLTKTDNGGLTLTAANSYTNGTILDGGTLTLNNLSAAGPGTITLNGGILAISAIKPVNTINVAGNSEVTGGNSGGLTGIKNVTGSSNLLVAVTTTSGVFDLTGDMSTYSGVITFTNVGGAVVRLNGAIGSQLATWDLGIGPMDLNVRTSSSSNNIGALRGAVGTTLSGRGGAGNNGATTHYIGANGLNTTFDGVIQNGAGGTASTTAINKVGGGTLALSGANTYTGNTTISSGVLALVFNATNNADGSIDDSPLIDIVSGTTLDVSGRSDGTYQVAYSTTQMLEGRGTINGSLNVNSSGTVAPGGGPGGNTGTLTVTNAVMLSGTAWMKLNRANTPNSDQVVSSLATITYGGTLIVTNIGASLHAGDTFTLFSGGGLSAASFSTITLPNYYAWNTNNLGVNGSISVSAVSPPAITNADFSLLLSNGTITLNAANGVPGGQVVVLTTTNLLNSWTPVVTNTFDPNGNLSQAITVDPTLPQSFYMLQAY